MKGLKRRNYAFCAANHRVQVIETTDAHTFWTFVAGQHEEADDPQGYHAMGLIQDAVSIKCIECKWLVRIPNRHSDRLPAWVSTLLKMIWDKENP